MTGLGFALLNNNRLEKKIFQYHQTTNETRFLTGKMQI